MPDYPESSTIYFYAQTDPYAEFSNFAPYGVAMDDIWWPTVEHYFQAQKFHDVDYREQIRRCSKPKDAKALGMTRKLALREDWEQVKDQIMLDAVRVKFQTHPAPRDLLLSTGTAEIVENAPMDAYWGCGLDGSGLNKLGYILMAVRNKLRIE
ncbi:NADAR family protein [Parasulfitobacter algicola]|uniref:NADAR family protein n=1 Tax=Parasulfitobacter algicola TaxID=2614809 RepID=A0ABX2IPQ9_9RHOB|nr:NADAR family protein [Sulfitobacter algicola]NSX54872.1 NADAR family protein [Sulfitobacter algicola]